MAHALTLRPRATVPEEPARCARQRRLLLLQSANIVSSSRVSERKVSPSPAGSPGKRPREEACVTAGVGARPRRLPGVFRWPVMTASPVTGCSQVVLLASSLLVKKRRGRKKVNQNGGGKNDRKKSQYTSMRCYPRDIYLMKNIRPSRVTP